MAAFFSSLFFPFVFNASDLFKLTLQKETRKKERKKKQEKNDETKLSKDDRTKTQIYKDPFHIVGVCLGGRRRDVSRWAV